MNQSFPDFMLLSLFGSLATPLVLMLMGTFWIAAAHGTSIRRLSRFRGGVLLLLGAILLPIMGVIGMMIFDSIFGRGDPLLRILIIPSIIIAPPLMLMGGFYLLIDSVLPSGHDRSTVFPPPPPRDNQRGGD